MNPAPATLVDPFEVSIVTINSVMSAREIELADEL
jgi:hypothetical protein